MDYIRRDGYFAGVSVNYDLDRLLCQVAVEEAPVSEAAFPEKTAFQLVMPMKGVNVLEQIVISKFMLYSYLYHHPKVRAAERQMASLVSTEFKQLGINNGLDYLSMNDNDLYSKGGLKIRAIFNRKLLFKAVELDIRSLSDIVKCSSNGQKLQASFKQDVMVKEIGDSDVSSIGVAHLDEEEAQQRELIVSIVSAGMNSLGDKFIDEYKNEVKRMCEARGKSVLEEHELIVDFPGRLKLDQFQRIFVKDRSGQYVQLLKVFPIDSWEESYYHTKWRAYIYCPRDYREIVRISFETCLKAKGITIPDGSDLLRSSKTKKRRRVSAPLFEGLD